MAEAGSSGWSIPWPALLGLALAAGGAYFLIPPLVSSRPPAADARPPAVPGTEDVYARVWEDPFRAAQHYREEEKSAGRSSGVVVREGGQTAASGTLPAVNGRAPDEAVRESRNHVLSRLADELGELARASNASAPTLVLPVMVEAAPKPKTPSSASGPGRPCCPDWRRPVTCLGIPHTSGT